MSLDIALRQLASSVADAEGRAAKSPLRLVLGTVSTVTVGGAADGNAAVTVSIGGSAQLAPYLESYTPTAGDLVAVLLSAGAPLILGQVIGLPNF